LRFSTIRDCLGCHERSLLSGAGTLGIRIPQDMPDPGDPREQKKF